MNDLTFEEVEQDRVASAIDLEILKDVTSGISRFISNGYTCGEDRKFFRIDLMKWQSLLIEAEKMHENILKKHAELKPKP